MVDTACYIQPREEEQWVQKSLLNRVQGMKTAESESFVIKKLENDKESWNNFEKL